MSFVDTVPYRATSVYAPINDIQNTIDYTRDYANEQRNALSLAIENLEALVGSYTPNFDNISANIPSIVSPSYPDAPDLTVDLNENWPENNIPDPMIRDISPDFSFIDPVPPDQIDPSFDYTPGVYVSCLWNELCSSIRNTLINGGTGLSDLIYSLIIDRNQEARRNVEDAARQHVYDAVGSKGFDLAGGQVAAVILEFEKDILAKDLDAVNSTTIKDFELADANSRFAKELAARMEEIQRTAYDNDENRLFEIAKVSKELIIAIFEQNVKIFISQWEGIKIKLEAIKIQVDTIIAYNENQIKVFLGRIEGFKIENEAIAAENNSKTDTAKAKVDIYGTEVNAISTQFMALVEEVKIALEQYRLELDESIKKEKINLEAYTSAAALAERVAESVANIASQSIASALGALNTTESIGYNGNESVRYGATLTNSLQEGHSYEEE